MGKFTFNAVSTVHKKRSFFDLSHGVKTSMSLGTLYPIECEEVLPGSTFRVHENHVARLTTSFKRPVMDNMFMDVYYFFVPSRLVFDKFPEIFGENKKSKWSRASVVKVPVTTSKGVISSGSVGDYLGLPVGSVPSGLSLLPFRAFALIYDEWFRNENTVDPMLVQTGNATTGEVPNNNPWSPSNYMGKLPKVSKKKDYFTSCLPSPQKGDPVAISLGSQAPLVGYGMRNTAPVKDVDITSSTSSLTCPTLYDYNDPQTPLMPGTLTVNAGHTLSYSDSTQHAGDPQIGFVLGADLTGSYADLSKVSPVTINDLRLAFQTQRILELDARGGTRYREYLLAHFGVNNADARMQVPEFLGGKRVALNIQQVAQTSQSTDEEALGTLGAFSYSAGSGGFSKSFSEHGYIFKVACIRQLHTYQQGIDKMWFRQERYDFYDPLFAYLGEQPVYSQQIFADSSKSLKQDIFGYNEAWAEYRFKPSIVTGQMRSGVDVSLDVYHFADYYSNSPVLGQEFTDETSIFFDRTLAVPSTSMDNFVVDFWFNERVYHVMPVKSTPGLIDHTY